jgi:HPt (histidine-containing phosphotransfer) domain-containing protein
MAQTPASIDNSTPDAVRLPARPIDLVHLARQCLGDAGLEHEILRLFETTARTYFGRLEIAVTAEDMALNLHSLKGAASGIGAWAIADLAKTAEADLQAGHRPSAERISDLSIAIEESSAFIADFLGQEEE